MRTLRFQGREIPLTEAGRIFIRAWEEQERLRLKQLMFRIPVHYSVGKSGHVYEHDFNLQLTNELVYRCLSMPKVGTRIGFVEAINKRNNACFDASGELTSFEPCDQDIIEWAKERGYYIEFDELEILDEACRQAG